MATDPASSIMATDPASAVSRVRCPKCGHSTFLVLERTLRTSHGQVVSGEETLACVGCALRITHDPTRGELETVEYEVVAAEREEREAWMRYNAAVGKRRAAIERMLAAKAGRP